MGEPAARTAGPPDADGWVQARIPVEAADHAVGDLLRLGAEIEVLEPPELRQAMGDVVARLGAAYGL
jgi:predicted DNA-binding transcriptional regulator YafY